MGVWSSNLHLCTHLSDDAFPPPIEALSSYYTSIKSYFNLETSTWMKNTLHAHHSKIPDILTPSAITRCLDSSSLEPRLCRNSPFFQIWFVVQTPDRCFYTLWTEASAAHAGLRAPSCDTWERCSKSAITRCWESAFDGSCWTYKEEPSGIAVHRWCSSDWSFQIYIHFHVLLWYFCNLHMTSRFAHIICR